MKTLKNVRTAMIVTNRCHHGCSFCTKSKDAIDTESIGLISLNSLPLTFNYRHGVFEYLLGEMLNIISEKGKGQLIFTSHNLRPLETIDKGFIAFTTTNPKSITLPTILKSLWRLERQVKHIKLSYNKIRHML